MNHFPFVVVLGTDKILAVQRLEAVVPESLNAVVARGENLQHELEHSAISSRKASRKEAEQRLRTFDHCSYSFAAISSIRIGTEISEVIFHLRINLPAGTLE